MAKECIHEEEDEVPFGDGVDAADATDTAAPADDDGDGNEDDDDDEEEEDQSINPEELKAGKCK